MVVCFHGRLTTRCVLLFVRLLVCLFVRSRGCRVTKRVIKTKKINKRVYSRNHLAREKNVYQRILRK